MCVLLSPGAVECSTAEMDTVLSVSSCTSNTCLSVSSSSTNNNSNLLAKSRKRRRKSVGFASHNKVVIVERTEETWYSLQDYAAFEQEVRSLIRNLRCCHEGEEISLTTCERGLEKYLHPRFHQEKRERQRCLYGAILDEQCRQKKEGLCDANKLAMLSLLYSRWSTERAIALADQYEKEELEEEQDWA